MTSASDHRLFFFRFYDNAHPIRIFTRVCAKRNQGRKTVVAANVIAKKAGYNI
jgi:hypothetical protein